MQRGVENTSIKGATREANRGTRNQAQGTIGEVRDVRECAIGLKANARQLRDRGMRDSARHAGIVEGRGGPSERPVLTISGSGEGGQKRGGTPVC